MGDEIMLETNVTTLLLNAAPFLLKGALLTLQIALCATTIGLIFGFMLGILNSNKLRVPVLSQLIDLYVLVVRGTPVYVQVLIFYYALPDLLGINFSPFAAGTIALGCNSIAYITEIIRSGINAIPAEQWDACYVLGYGVTKTHAQIILPQVLRNCLPVLTGELVVLLKETAILSTIGIAEMTRVAMNINAKHLKPMPIYLAIAVLYLVMTTTIAIISKKIEKGLSYD